jgi:HEAT repeats/CHAT domain
VTIGKSEAVRAIRQFLTGKVPYAEDFARKCLRDLQRHHLLQAGAGNEELKFRHQLIQEYYAAEALLERLPGLSDAILQREYLNYLKWTEPVALMLALVESEDQALRVVRSGLGVDLFLGARLAGDVKIHHQEQAIEFLNRWICDRSINYIGRIELLGHTASGYALPQSLNALQNQNPFVRKSAAKALGNIGSERATKVLITAIQNKDPSTRKSVGEALIKIGGERATEAVLSAVLDGLNYWLANQPKPPVNIGSEWNSANASDKGSKEQTIEALAIALLDKNYNHEIYQSRPEFSTTSNCTILILAANPADYDNLSLATEVREIEEALRRAKHGDRLTLRQRWAVRPDDLRRALLDYCPHILHFCGHGEGETGIVLENDRGKAKLVSTQAIANLFKLVADQGLECVILNACYSEIQAEAIAQYIPYVIGMSDSILDKTALKFAIGFYDALGAGWSYEKAYEMEKNAIDTEGIPEANLPVLKRQKGGQQ